MVRKEPQQLEAEAMILGSAFLSKSALDKICEELTSEMFYSEANQKIFDCIKELHTKNIPIDSTTVLNELEKKKLLSSIGGIEYLTDVINSVATVANLDYHINIIFDKYILRNLISSSTEIIESAYEEKSDVEELVEDAERKILAVNSDKLGKEILSIKNILPEVQENIEELAKNKSGISGISSGFYDLDKITKGFHKNQVIIIAGRPGSGKSAFALNIATNMAINSKKTVAFFSLEMGADELVKRMFASVGQIEGDTLATGKLNHTDWKKLNEAMSELADTNFYIDDTAGITVGEIRRKCRRLKNSSTGLDVIIIDYLQLISSSNKYAGNRVQEVSEVSRDIKKLAMELEVPVIALAQLSRSAEQRKGEDRKPKLSDLRESGSIEQDADIVIFLYYEDLINQTVPIDLLISKHRSGATGAIKILFEKSMSSFKNYLNSEES